MSGAARRRTVASASRIWRVDYLRALLAGMNPAFTATASDPGSDDLTFIWEWGDGTPATATTYYNDGVGPDPYPSSGSAFPFTATDVQIHAYITAGMHAVTLTVLDDDGGTATLTLSSLVSPAKGLLTCHDVGSRHLPVQDEAYAPASQLPHVHDRPPFDPSPPSGS